MVAVSLLGRDDGRGSSKASSDESSDLHDGVVVSRRYYVLQ